MAKRRRRAKGPDEPINMTPMIDVVFQMIIFFVCTADMDRKAFDEKIRLALAPHGPAVEQKDPRTVTIEVGQFPIGNKSFIKVGSGYVSLDTLKLIMKKAVSQSGWTTPVVIRGDGNVRHEEIRKVMDACAAAGLFRIKFAATKEKAPKV